MFPTLFPLCFPWLTSDASTRTSSAVLLHLPTLEVWPTLSCSFSSFAFFPFPMLRLISQCEVHVLSCFPCTGCLSLVSGEQSDVSCSLCSLEAALEVLLKEKSLSCCALPEPSVPDVSHPKSNPGECLLSVQSLLRLTFDIQRAIVENVWYVSKGSDPAVKPTWGWAHSCSGKERAGGWTGNHVLTWKNENSWCWSRGERLLIQSMLLLHVGCRQKQSAGEL